MRVSGKGEKRWGKERGEDSAAEAPAGGGRKSWPDNNWSGTPRTSFFFSFFPSSFFLSFSCKTQLWPLLEKVEQVIGSLDERRRNGLFFYHQLQ